MKSYGKCGRLIISSSVEESRKCAYRQPMYDSNSLALLDDIRQNAQSGCHALVVAWASSNGVNVNGTAAIFPIDVRRMDHVLDLLDQCRMRQSVFRDHNSSRTSVLCFSTVSMLVIQ